MKTFDLIEWMSKGLSITILPALAYFLEFNYEKGYCANFGIPDYFIKPDITTILIFFSSLWGISILLIMVVDSLISLTEREEATTPCRHAANKYLPFLMLFLFMYFIYGDYLRESLWILVFVLVLSALDLLYAAIDEDNSKPFLLRLRGPAHLLMSGYTVFTIVKSRFGMGVLALFIIVFLGSFVCRSLGNAEALKQKIYLVPSLYPDMVLARVYGDTAICCQIDMSTKKPQNTYAIIQLSKETNNVFSAEEIGPLKFE